MSLSAQRIVEVAWGKTFADPPVERGITNLNLLGSDIYAAADSASLSITGNILVAADWTPVGSTWVPSAYVYLLGKGTSAATPDYALGIDPDGLIVFNWTDSGSTTREVKSTVPPPFTGTQRGRVAAGISVSPGGGNYFVEFHYSYDGQRWTEFDQVTGTGTTSIKDTAGALVAVAGDTSDVVHEIWVYSGHQVGSDGRPTGTLVANPHFHDSLIFNDSNGTDAQSNTWTQSGDATTGGDWTRIDPYVKAASIATGKTRLTDTYQAGTATVVLTNEDRRFEPGYTAGAYSDDVVVGVPIRVRVHYNYQARSRFTGFVDRWEARYGDAAKGAETVAYCSDAFRTLARLLVSGVEAEIAADAPVGWWKLDETTGTTATDSGSSGTNGTATNGPFLGAYGPRGMRAWRFGSSGDPHVAIGTGTGIDNTGPWTVETWFNPNTAATDAAMNVVCWDANSADDDMAITCYGGSHPDYPYRIRLRYGDTAGASFNAIASAPGAGWRHVVITGEDTVTPVTLHGIINNTGTTTSGQNHTLDMPASSPGDTIIASVSKVANVTVGWPSGWTEIQDYGNANGGAAIAYKTYTDTPPDTITVTTSAADTLGYQIASFSGVDSVEHNSTNGSSGEIDCPSETAAATPSLWVAVGAGRDTGGPTATTPAGYTSAGVRTSATLLNAMYYKTGAASTENPAAMTTSGFDAWAGATIALHAATGVTQIKAYVDGALAATIDTYDDVNVDGEMNITIAKDRGTATQSFAGRVCQVAVYDKRLGDGRIAAHYAAAIGAMPAEDYAARITRLLDRAGVTIDTCLDTATYDLTEFDTINLPPTSLLELIRQAADSEGGAVHIDGEGRLRGRSYTTRSTYEATSLWTVNKGRRPSFSLDDDFYYNRVLIGAAESGEIVSAEDAALVASDGLRVLDLGDLDLSVADATTVATAKLAEYKTPARWCPAVVITPESDPANMWPEIRDLQLGERVTFTFAPPGGGTDISEAHHVEHIRVTSTPETWEETWATTRASTA